MRLARNLDDIVGRAHELTVVRGFVARSAEGPGALVLTGEAGAGKTTLWQTGVHGAEESGLRVLLARPADTESALPFAALGDLLETWADRFLLQLPEPQRVALEVALQRSLPSGGDGLEQLTVGRALVASLRALAADTPLLIAVDDVQWLDAPTARALEFAVRRLIDTHVTWLLAWRERAGAVPLALDRAGMRVESVHVGPMPPDELGLLLERRLRIRLSRPRLLQVHSACAGNPFYALEIVRASGDGPLQVPDRLADLPRRRIRALEPEARDVILLAATSSHPTFHGVGAAAGGSAGLSAALDADILRADGERLRFAHPLLATVAYEAAMPEQRRDAHRRLAAVVPDPTEAALHLALATTEPGEEIARRLEAAATEAARRGASEAAAELAEQAARLSPAQDDAHVRERLTAAAEHHLAAGAPARARACFERAVADLPPGRARAEGLYRLTDALHDVPTQIGLCEQALEEAGDDHALRAHIHLRLAAYRWSHGDLLASAAEVLTAGRAAEETGDEALVAMALADFAHAEAALGHSLPRAEAQRALEIERRVDSIPHHGRPSYQLGIAHFYLDDLDEARRLLTEHLQRATTVGDASARVAALFWLSGVECRAGNLAAADRHARECHALAVGAGTDQELVASLTALTTAAAYLGRVEEAKSAGARGLALASEVGDARLEARLSGALGMLELSLGEVEAAYTLLQPATEHLLELGLGALAPYGVVDNALEALVALGRLEEASGLAAHLARKGEECQRPWTQAVADRGRALILAAQGDTDAARVHLDRCFAVHDQQNQPLELARTLLAQGRVERRAKRRGAAYTALRSALGLFDAVGASLWSERTAAELQRLGGRMPAGSELTATERRVADLVAAGRTNREVAAELFVTVRAVEANLSRIYAKLGVRSRTELARMLADI